MKMLKLDMSLMQTVFDGIQKYWLVSLIVFDYTILQVFKCSGIYGTSQTLLAVIVLIKYLYYGSTYILPAIHDDKLRVPEVNRKILAEKKIK